MPDLDEILDQQDVDQSERPDDYDETYTEPALRWRLKEAIQASGQGGEPGEWSARKAQRLVQEYERRGGGYRGDKSASQRSLEEWTQQDWQTAEGSAEAAAGDGMSRYLPRDAWALLTEDARREAERSKQEADDRGEQYADWPDAVHRVMNELGYTGGGEGLTKAELYARAQELGVDGRSNMTKAELKTAILDATRDAEGAPTKAELYTRAQALGISGRSQMTKAELEAAVAGARST